MANLHIFGTICKGVTNRVLGSNERGNIVAMCHRNFLLYTQLVVVVTKGTSSPKGDDRSPESNVPSQISFKTSMETSLSHYNSLEYFSNTQGPQIPQ